MPSKSSVARSVHANIGVEMRYSRAMVNLIAEMSASAERWVTATYRKEPSKLAADAAPLAAMRRQLKELGARWIKRFNDSAPLIARAYLKGAFKHTDSAMRQALKDAGWAIKFEMTPAMKEAFTASLEENVGLIKSIPEQYLQQVQGVVMRSYTAGRDLHTMVKELRALYPKAAHRAVLISRDQSNKANAVVNRARQLELGVVEAVWMHSHAGVTPRPTHLANNGKRYKVAEGWFDPAEGRYIFPGELINCRCTSRIVLPFNLSK